MKMMKNKKMVFAVASVLLAVMVCLSSVSAFAADDLVVPDPKDGVETDVGVVPGEGSIPENGVSSEVDAQSSENSGTESTDLAGDVDGNGVVNINDVTIFQLTLVGKIAPTPAYEKNGDTYLDNQKTIRDATTIQMYRAGKLKEIPITTDGYYARIIRP